MRKHKLYLDTWIIFPFYYEEDSEHKKALDFFKEILKKKTVTLCISHFSLTELVKVFTDKIDKNKNINSKYNVDKIVSTIVRVKKIGQKYPVSILKCEGKKKKQEYEFDDFFLQIQDILIETKPRIPIKK